MFRARFFNTLLSTFHIGSYFGETAFNKYWNFVEFTLHCVEHQWNLLPQMVGTTTGAIGELDVKRNGPAIHTIQASNKSSLFPAQKLLWKVHSRHMVNPQHWWWQIWNIICNFGTSHLFCTSIQNPQPTTTSLPVTVSCSYITKATLIRNY